MRDGSGNRSGDGPGGRGRRGATAQRAARASSSACKGMVLGRTVPQSMDEIASLLRSCGGGGGEDGANRASQFKSSRGTHGKWALSAGNSAVGGRCSASPGAGRAPGAEGRAASCTARSQPCRSARSAHWNCSSRPRLVCTTSLPSVVVATEQFRSRAHEPVRLPLLYQLISCGDTTTCRGFHCLSHSDRFSSWPAPPHTRARSQGVVGRRLGARDWSRGSAPRLLASNDPPPSTAPPMASRCGIFRRPDALRRCT